MYYSTLHGATLTDKVLYHTVVPYGTHVCIAAHYMTLQRNRLHYIAEGNCAAHGITLYCITLHRIALDYTALHYIVLRCNTGHGTELHYNWAYNLQCTILFYIMSYHTSSHYITVQHTTIHDMFFPPPQRTSPTDHHNRPRKLLKIQSLLSSCTRAKLYSTATLHQFRASGTGAAPIVPELQALALRWFG